MKSFSAILLALLVCSAAAAHSKDEWRSRTIYQVLTDRFAKTNGDTSPCGNLGNYCGGTFRGLMNNLDYIQGMGFDAIWVSPIVKNTDGGYHGYWAKDLYSLNENFGSEQDFRDLVSEMHKRGMWIMVDVVANHMGPVGMDFSGINPFNRGEHYHNPCQISDQDFQNHNQHNIEYCRLADLPDLNQQDGGWVKDTLLSWIKDLVQKYDIDGIRIDTIPEVGKSFWKDFNNAAGCYAVGECFDGSTDYVANYQHDGLDGLLNYPIYFTIKSAFVEGQSMRNFHSAIEYGKTKFADVSLLGDFVDNHDNARFLNMNGDHRQFKSALTFAILNRGIPIVYYGSEQGYAGGNDPNNREQLWTNMDKSHPLYSHIATVVGARKQFQVWNHDHVERYVDDDFYAWSRGNLVAAVTNRPDQTVTRGVTYHPFKEGQTVCNVFYPSDCTTISGGTLNVVLKNGESKIYVDKSQVSLGTVTY